MSAILESAAFMEAFAASKAFLEGEAMIIERERAARIVDRAQQLVHVGGSDDPNAGETRDSIKIQGEGVDGGMPYVDVGSTLEKAVYEEFGTSRSPAIPFMRPAIAEER